MLFAMVVMEHQMCLHGSVSYISQISLKHWFVWDAHTCSSLGLY
jgi:hypothetical protein